MITPELVAAIKQRKIAGETNEDIIKSLLSQGLSVQDINEALNAALGIGGQATPAPAPAPAVAPAPIAAPPPVPTYTPGTPAPVMPAPTPAPVPPAMPTATQTVAQPPAWNLPSQKKSTFPARSLAYIAGILLVLVIAGGVAYAYVEKLGPFSRAPYTEKNLMSGLLAASSKIDSSSYEFTGTLTTEARDTDATPFTLEVSNEAEVRQHLQNDSDRLRTVSMFYSMTHSSNGYPATLAAAKQQAMASPSGSSSYYTSYYNSFSTVDPVTKAPYSYQLTDGGRNFALQITFESNEAITAIKRRGYSATSTPISGKTVTFTKDSYPYVYVSTEPSKPLFVQLQEMTQYAPADLNAKFGVKAAGNWKDEKTDWNFNGDAEGDFGDLTYKINIDALKKDENYYIRINNIPSLFIGSLSTLRGQWVVITPEDMSSDDSYSSIGSLAKSLPKTEEEYKKNREEITDLIKKAAQYADEEGLIAFKNPPQAERIDGKQLYRYDLEVRKDAVVPFYKKLIAEAAANPSSSWAKSLNDPGLLEYLQSKEFDQVFDYFQKNTTLTLYADAQGYPVIIEQSIRVVPPDTATQLKDKQLRATFRIELSDINKDIKIEAPKDAKPIKDVMDSYTSGAREKGASAAQRSYLNNIRAQAELYYDEAGSYSTVSIAAGACKKVAGSMFNDSQVFSFIQNASPNKDASKSTCAATRTAYAISTPLQSDASYSWCIDSSGASKQISGAVKSTSC